MKSARLMGSISCNGKSVFSRNGEGNVIVSMYEIKYHC